MEILVLHRKGSFLFALSKNKLNASSSIIMSQVLIFLSSDIFHGAKHFQVSRRLFWNLRTTFGSGLHD